jgi:hypothetical protein
MLPNVAVHIIQRGNNRQACFHQHTPTRWLANFT